MLELPTAGQASWNWGRQGCGGAHECCVDMAMSVSMIVRCFLLWLQVGGLGASLAWWFWRKPAAVGNNL